MSAGEWIREEAEIPQVKGPFEFHLDEFHLHVKRQEIEVQQTKKTAHIVVLESNTEIKELVDISFNEFEAKESLRDFMQKFPEKEELGEYLTAKYEAQKVKEARDKVERQQDNSRRFP